MKRKVNCSQDIVEAAFGEIINAAYNVGYDLNVDDELNVTLTARHEQMPNIVTTKIQDNDTTYYDVKVTFPELSSGPDQFADSIEYSTYKFYQVGRFITKLIRFTYNPNDYED